MKRNYKSLLSIALVLLLVAVTSLTFAYWDQLTGEGTGSIDLGEGKTVTVSQEITAGEGKTLIPADALQGANDVTEIKYTYNVNIDQALDPNALDDYELVVNLTELTDTTGLINVNIEGTPLTNAGINTPVKLAVDSTNTVVVIITLTEPTGTTAEDDYATLTNGTPITFKLSFEIKKA